MIGDSISRPFKILYTIPNFDTSGSGKALLNIAKRLNRKYFQPHICCAHDKGKFFKEICNEDIPIHLYKTNIEMKPRINGLLKCIRLASFLKSLKIDLIHSFHYGPDYSEALAAKLIGIPWIYTKKNMNWGGPSKNGWRLRSYFASHIIFQNKDMLKLFFNNYKNATIVPRGVDTKLYSKRKKNIKILKDNRINKEEKIILSVANLVPIKGINLLINAFEHICKDNLNVSLIIVGDYDNEYGSTIKDQVTKSKFSNKIYLTGKINDITGYYSIADIFVLPTLDQGEGSPVALLEAMSSGVPVIASNVPGSRDILEPFPELMFNPGSVSDIVKKLESLLLKKNETIIKSLLNRVKSNYFIEKEVLHHEKIYKNCLNH
tara:strand:- start:161 stop:1288 length:1128 start_codon:yes stop_codon:yes gene_type:complete